MTQSSLFWTTSGTGDGAAAGYTPEQIWTLLRALFGSDGVALDFLNELEPTLVASTATIASGAALVAGIPYTNDAAIDTAVPAPTAQNRYDRMVLRANWQLQTVRVARLAGVEGVMTPTALTQQRGGIYEIALATIGVDATRVIGADTTLTATTYVASLEVSDGFYLEVSDGAQLIIEEIAGLTDDRSWLTTVHSVLSSQLAASAVTTAKLADGAVTNAKLADMAQATVLGRVSSGSGDAEAVTLAQLITLINSTAPTHTISADTTLSASYTTEWIEVANGVYLELANGVTLTLDNGAGNGIDADLLDGNHASGLADAVHAHSAYAALAHAHSAYAALAHAHSAYAALAHAHTGYAALAHAHGASELPEISNAKLAEMAEATVKGRAVGAGTGDPTDLTATQLIQILNTLTGVADGIDADTLDTIHASGLADAVHTHSGYAALSHTHSGYAALAHTHSGVTTRTVAVSEDVWTGSIKEAIWQDVVFISGDLAIDSGGAPLGNSGYITAFAPVAPINTSTMAVHLSDGGAPFQVFHSAFGLFITAPSNFTDGDTLRFSMVYMAS